jgi:hypothetical protein
MQRALARHFDRAGEWFWVFACRQRLDEPFSARDADLICAGELRVEEFHHLSGPWPKVRRDSRICQP